MTFPRVVFRVDASLEMGNGHLMRCLTLADAFHAVGLECVFVTREHAGNMVQLIEQKGYKVYLLARGQKFTHQELPYSDWLGVTQEQDATDTLPHVERLKPCLLVVDHYALDFRWERLMRSHSHKIMVIDDLADRVHDCDLLLDQTYGRSSNDYTKLVPESALVLCGAEYALLRPDFLSLRNECLHRRRMRVPRRILISMGGVDKDNITLRILAALNSKMGVHGYEVVVVMGQNAPWLKQVRDFAAQMLTPVNVRVGVTDMASLMSDSDIAIGAAGSTSWERCCLGLPTIMVVLAENQRLAASLLKSAGAVELLSLAAEFEVDLIRAIKKLMTCSAVRNEMIDRAAAVTNGSGCNQIVLQIKKWAEL